MKRFAIYNLLRRSSCVRIIMLLAIFNFPSSIFNSVRAQDAFYIYQNDGHFDGFFYDEIEKISYSFLDTLGIEHNEIVSQEIITADSIYRIMLSAIDSVGFVQPEVKYNPRVRRVEEVNTRYAIGWNEETNILGITVRNNKNIRDEELPHPGDVFVNFSIDNGWAVKVLSITKNPASDNYYTYYDVACEPVTDISDIFQQFVTVEEYGYDDEGNLARRRVAGRPDLTVGQFPRRASHGTWEGDIFNFAISGHIPIYATDDLNITLDPSIEGKLHVKTAWNLSWLGDKYIGITSKLKFGVGLAFTVDGKLKDFFPSGIGKLGSIPVPATCPILIIDCGPDAFLRGEAHAKFSLATPNLNGSMWAKLELKNWKPSMDMGFGNSDDGSEFKSVDNSNYGFSMSFNGFIQTGMLFPMKFKSLPILKRICDVEVGGQWFVGPKVSADLSVDLTTMPWNDVASYNQLKGLTFGVHPLDADFEVKAKAETLAGVSDVTLADGSINILPPYNASFVPEFDDVADYDSTTVVGDKVRDCRVISFKPTGYVIKPVNVGIALFDIKEDGTIDYNWPSITVGDRSYYHIAELLGQELGRDLWPKCVIPYLIGRTTGSLVSSKQRAVPYVRIGVTPYFAPDYYDFQIEPMAEADNDAWVLDWDGTTTTPYTITGYIDSINGWSGREQFYDNLGYLGFTKTSAGNGKDCFTATMNLEKYQINYNPVDTLLDEFSLALHKKIDDDYTHHLHFPMNTFILPCPKDPVLTQIQITPGSMGNLSLWAEKPNATIERLERTPDSPHGGWHVALDYQEGSKKAQVTFDIICDNWRRNGYAIKNSYLTYSSSYLSGNDYYSCSISGSLDGIAQYNGYFSTNPEGTLGDTFSIQCRVLKGTYHHNNSRTGVEEDNETQDFYINIVFSFEE